VQDVRGGRVGLVDVVVYPAAGVGDSIQPLGDEVDDSVDTVVL